MGAKTTLLAFADTDVPSALMGATRSERSRAEDLVRRIHPGHTVEFERESELLYCTQPADGVTYAAALPGADVICDRGVALDRPSELPDHLLSLGKGRRTVLHAMHSVVDWTAFAVWEDGELIRSLSLAPDHGVMEDIGEPFPFERPYWAGQCPMDEDYPLPFHPLELAEDALAALFGFVMEGHPDGNVVDAEAVVMHGYRVTGPAGR